MSLFTTEGNIFKDKTAISAVNIYIYIYIYTPISANYKPV